MPSRPHAPLPALAAVAAALASAVPAGPAAEASDATVLPEPADLEGLQAMIRPQPGESPWREIAWLTDVTAARRKAAEEGKPLVIFTAADGSPLGRT